MENGLETFSHLSLVTLNFALLSLDLFLFLGKGESVPVLNKYYTIKTNGSVIPDLSTRWI